MNWPNGITNDSASKPMDIKEMVDTIKSMMVKADVQKSRTYFAILQMEPCTVCGEKIEYRDQPYEHFVMCRHIAAHIPTKPADTTMGFPGMVPLDAMPVVFK